MGMNLSEISEGIFYAQYIGWDPALQVFRDRPNHSLVRVQVIKNDEGALLVSLPHVSSPAPLNPVRLENAIKEWRFVRRVRMSSTRILTEPRQNVSGIRSTVPAEAVQNSSTAGGAVPGGGA